MRINVYAEELTDEVEVITKTAEGKFGTQTFYGVRLYLKSAPELHADTEDDDRTAITFWVPWTKAGGNDFAALQDIFYKLQIETGDLESLVELEEAEHQDAE